jgi:hypothetical protein
MEARMLKGGVVKQEPLLSMPASWPGVGMTKLCRIQCDEHFTVSYDVMASVPGKPGVYTPALDIDITDNLEIIISLDPPNWYWSPYLEAITVSRSLNFYGKLLYCDAKGVFGPGPLPTCKSVSFLAAKNGNDPRDDKSDNVHEFSMNIVIVQPDGQLLPITIDPDIKNPPVGSGVLGFPGRHFLFAQA